MTRFVLRTVTAFLLLASGCLKAQECKSQECSAVGRSSVLFENNFDEHGDSGFSFMTQGVTLSTEPSRSKPYASSIHYLLCSDLKNAGCGSAHQDSNRWLEVDFNAANGFPRGLDKVFVRASIYFQSPAKSAKKDGIQRKIFFLKAPSGPGGVPNCRWGVVLTSDSADGKIGLRFQYQSLGGVISSALYGTANELGMKNGVVNGIVQLDYDRWYTLEMQVSKKSRPGASDSEIRLWVDGQLVFEKSKTWTTGSSPCRPRGSSVCSAFPDDAVFDFGISRIEIGTQSDRQNYDPVDEFRFFDDIAIAEHYIGPP